MFEAESAVTQVVNLRRGQTYSRSIFIPVVKATRNRVVVTKRRIVGGLTPIVSRANRQKKRQTYRIYTTASLTKDCEAMIITGVIVRDDAPRKEPL